MDRCSQDLGGIHISKIQKTLAIARNFTKTVAIRFIHKNELLFGIQINKIYKFIAEHHYTKKNVFAFIAIK